MKTCTRCGREKPREEFYQQKRYNRKLGEHYRFKAECKTCSIKLSSAWAISNPKSRARIQRRYASTPHGKVAVRRGYDTQAEKYPDRRRARAKLSNAVRRGTIQQQPCQVCGADKVEAHHDDYLKPFDVVWLCRMDHQRHHSHGRERRKQIGVARIAPR